MAATSPAAKTPGQPVTSPNSSQRIRPWTMSTGKRCTTGSMPVPAVAIRLRVAITSPLDSRTSCAEADATFAPNRTSIPRLVRSFRAIAETFSLMLGSTRVPGSTHTIRTRDLDKWGYNGIDSPISPSIDRHAAVLEINLADFVHVDADPWQDLAQRHDDMLRLHRIGQHLGHQPVPEFDIVPADEGHVESLAWTLESKDLTGGPHAGVTASQDQNVVCHVHTASRRPRATVTDAGGRRRVRKRPNSSQAMATPSGTMSSSTGIAVVKARPGEIAGKP